MPRIRRIAAICVKRKLFEKIQKIAADNGMKAIVEGSNLDDNGDYRPDCRQSPSLESKVRYVTVI